MKLSRRVWLILVLGIFIIALVSMYTVYSRQASQQEELKDELTRANTDFTLLTLQIDSLESQLLQRNSELTAALANLSVARDRFPESVDSIYYGEELFRIAD